ncbi:type VI secretion system protein TssA [Mangrovicoccus algicola]|uniref:Type VI secretion system protein TssA n=1 Tax=Mangrovicoccus algicola TaxID=2771008 RepID=A0A8J7CYI5_9RHOB|nr:type VI secretion system protein TssA [Mangrovicoccus algicola]MBE3639612.1 type VI secretion system protein TssA [Mangrovicoccus algicola]
MPVLDLLTAFSDAAPSGPNPEYDEDFQALERAARPGEERQAGNEILAATEPDHRDVALRATQVLERCHDLRAAVLFTHAAAMTRGFEGLAEGTDYLRGALEQFWDSCHPPLDPDDPDDVAGYRINALAGLADGMTVLRAVRLAPLTLSSAFGRVTLPDLEIAEGEREAPEGGAAFADPAAVAAAFRDTDPAALSAIAAAARRALENVRAIEAVFDARVPGQGPDLAPLTRLLFKAVQRLEEEAGAGDPQEAPGAEAEGAAVPGADAPAAARRPAGAISTPADVRQALDRILEYYRRHEPSSPLPILLERARRLIGADFVTIMKDMAPLGVENVYLIGGIEDAEE